MDRGAKRAAPLAVLPAALLALASGEPFLALARLPTCAACGSLLAWRGSLAPALASHATRTLLAASLLPPG